MRFEQQGLELAFDDTGEGKRESVLLLHGLSEARSTWEPLVPAITERYRVMALDFRGHGESSHAPGTYRLTHYVQDVVALCETFLDRPFTVVGHSLGGVVAVSMAQIRPDLVRALLLEDPPLYRDGAGTFSMVFSLLRDWTTDLQLRHATVEEYEAALATMPSPNGSGSLADVLGKGGTRARALAFSRLDPDVFLPAIDGSGLDEAQPDVPVECPVLVLRADPSLLVAFTAENEARFRSTNPHAEVKTIPGASHLMHDEQPQGFLSELEGFLTEM